MAHPEGPQQVKIGILLARHPEDLGEWLADGAAFEAAGADALWIDLAPELELDPLVVTAALAAVTFRSLLVSALPVSSRPSRAAARTLATIGKLSHGRLRILARAAPSGERAAPSGESAEVSPDQEVFRRITGDLESFEHPHELDTAGRWVSAPPPDSRAAWRATLLDAAEGGFQGVLVPADPRLIDILRNPDDPGQRLDLYLAQG